VKLRGWYYVRGAGGDKQQQSTQFINVQLCTQVLRGGCASQGMHDVEVRIEE
jgi:hypothetical protein